MNYKKAVDEEEIYLISTHSPWLVKPLVKLFLQSADLASWAVLLFMDWIILDGGNKK